MVPFYIVWEKPHIFYRASVSHVMRLVYTDLELMKFNVFRLRNYFFNNLL